MFGSRVGFPSELRFLLYRAFIQALLSRVTLALARLSCKRLIVVGSWLGQTHVNIEGLAYCRNTAQHIVVIYF